MASIERTAYSRFQRLLTAQDLQRLFSPAPEVRRRRGKTSLGAAQLGQYESRVIQQSW